jgi:hypothetical protein
MTCDKCHAETKAKYFIVGIPEEESWCEQCCNDAGFAIPFELSLQRLLFFKAEGRWPKRGELKSNET